MDKHEQVAPPVPVGDGGLLRISRVQELLGSVSRSTVYELVKTSGLPAPIRLSSRHAVWVAADVHAWIAARIKAARQTQKPASQGCAR